MPVQTNTAKSTHKKKGSGACGSAGGGAGGGAGVVRCAAGSASGVGRVARDADPMAEESPDVKECQAARSERVLPQPVAPPIPPPLAPPPPAAPNNARATTSREKKNRVAGGDAAGGGGAGGRSGGGGGDGEYCEFCRHVDVPPNTRKKEMVTKVLFQHIARRSVHKYMLEYGCVWEKKKQNYYTDRHNDESVVADCFNRFLPMQASWDRRGPNWFPASLAALTPQALDYTRLVFGLGPDDPVPISRREGDPLGTYRTGTLTCAFEIICQLIVLCIFAPLHLNLQLNDVLQTRPHDCHLPLNVDTHHTVTHAALITFEQPANVGSRQRVTVAGGAHLSDRLKIHIDFLDERTFDSFTQETFERTGFPGQWLFDVDELVDPHTKRKYVRFVVPHELQHLLKCQVNHAVDKCKCDKPLLHIGKDESIYSQNVTSSQEWTHWGVTTLGKKSDGVGVMLLVFICMALGFGLPLTRAELQHVNSLRAVKSLEPLAETPGTVLFPYGKGDSKMGYWNFEHNNSQCDSVILMYEALFPHYQSGLEADNSGSNNKTKDDGFDEGKLCRDWGGVTQRKLRDMKVEALGTETQYSDLRVGDTMQCVFPEGQNCPAPWYAPEANRFDIKHSLGTMSAEDQTRLTKEVTLTKNRLEKMRKLNGEIEKRNAAAKKKSATAMVEALIEMHDTVVEEGFEGKAKGAKQMLGELGMWRKGMVKSKSDADVEKLRAAGKEELIPDKAMCWDLVLGELSVFKGERSQLEEMYHASGNLYCRGVKYHPEISCKGIEYGFGMSKLSYRRNNDCVAANLNRNVMASISMDVISMRRLWKLSRRCNESKHMYRKMYSDGGLKDDVTYEKLEKMMRSLKKSHRNIMEIEIDFLRAAEAEDAARKAATAAAAAAASAAPAAAATAPSVVFGGV